jgi:hypothetical protein
MAVAGVIAGDSCDAFVWNKKKQKEREETEDSDFYSTISMRLNLQRQAPFIRPHTPHIAGTQAPHPSASWRPRTRKWPRRRRATKARPRPTSHYPLEKNSLDPK